MPLMPGRLIAKSKVWLFNSREGMSGHMRQLRCGLVSSAAMHA